MSEDGPAPRQAVSTVEELAALVARLHAPGTGCPWCLEQTHESMRNYLVEEAYEAIDAIDRRDPRALVEELGDLLTLVLTHAELASQAGAFDLADVVRSASAKTIRRNPHIFGDARASTAEEVLRQWEAIKRAERGERAQEASILRGVPKTLPALIRAESIQERAAHVGFDWTDPTGVFDKILEEIEELRASSGPPQQTEELGDVMFSLVNLARHLGISAEGALQFASDKFTRRFEAIEAACRARGVQPEDLTLTELDALWEAAKAEETR